MSSVSPIPKYFRIISICLFGLALLLPTHCTNVQCSGFGAGFEAFFMGWILAMFKGGVSIAWFANPVYFLSFYWARKEPFVSAVFTVIAILIARTFLDGGELLLNEGGQTAYITKIQIGFWVWIGSMVVLFVGLIVALVDNIKTRRPVKRKS